MLIAVCAIGSIILYMISVSIAIGIFRRHSRDPKWKWLCTEYLEEIAGSIWPIWLPCLALWLIVTGIFSKPIMLLVRLSYWVEDRPKKIKTPKVKVPGARVINK